MTAAAGKANMEPKTTPKVRDGRGKMRFTYKPVPPKAPRKPRPPKQDAAKRRPHPLESWEGDAQQLLGHEQDLMESSDLCNRVFASKQEAFMAGRAPEWRGIEVPS